MTQPAHYEAWHHTLFAARYMEMVERLLALADEDPTGYVNHPEVKLLKRVKTAKNEALKAPAHAAYLLGNTLGENNRHWRRIKHGLPERFRLFFQFSSEELKVVFTWLNDQTTLRKKDGKTDVYAVFEKMLSSGEIPNQFTMLLQQSKKFEASSVAD